MELFFIYSVLLTVFNPILFGFNLSNIVCLFGTFISFMYIKECHYTIKKSILNLSILGFYILIILSNLYSKNLSSSAFTTLKFLLAFTVPLWLTAINVDKKTNDKLWKIIIVSNFTAALYGLYQMVFHVGNYHLAYGTANDVLRATGTFSTPNIFANYLCLTLPIIIIRAYKEKKILLLFQIVLNAVVLYGTYSRSSILSLAISIIIWLFIDYVFIKRNGKINNKQAITMFWIIVFLSIGFILFVASGKLDFLFQERSSNGIRQQTIQKAIYVFLSNPLGKGIGSGIGTILDGAYFNIAVNLGLLGVILIIVIAISSIYESIKIVKKINTPETQALLLMTILLWMLCFLENVPYNTLLTPIMGIMWFETNNIEYLINSKNNCKNNNKIGYFDYHLESNKERILLEDNK